MTAVAVTEPSTAPAVQTSVRAVGLLRPLANPGDIVQAQNDTRAMVHSALKEGRDYGVVPGTDKPALFKPGAERCTSAFGLTARFRVVEQEVDHDREVKWIKRKKVWRNEYKGDREFSWKEEAGVSLGLYRYVTECQLIHRDTGVVVGECLGVCSSMESKYIDRPRDSENTVVKMSQKRAFVGATLIALGLSDEFTQDTEDLAANGVIDPGNAGADSTERAGGNAADDVDAVSCPKCGGRMWNNRLTKRNAGAPDYKCRDRSCDGVIWPPREGEQRADPAESKNSETSTSQTSTGEMTLAEAKAMLVSENPKSFKGRGSDLLDSYDTPHLLGLRKWFEDRLREGPSAEFASRVEAITLLLDDREKDQTKLGLDTADTREAAEAGPGNVAAALEPVAKDARDPAGAAALTNDDLPF